MKVSVKNPIQNVVLFLPCTYKLNTGLNLPQIVSKASDMSSTIAMIAHSYGAIYHVRPRCRTLRDYLRARTSIIRLATLEEVVESSSIQNTCSQHPNTMKSPKGKCGTTLL